MTVQSATQGGDPGPESAGFIARRTPL